MRDLKWSNNLCHVGWTTIHAYEVTPDDMRALLALHPEGRFVPTFYRAVEDGGDVTTPEQAEGLVHLWNGKRWHGSYYFNFPFDEVGKSLLVSFGLEEPEHLQPWTKSLSGYKKDEAGTSSVSPS